jgi:hypothetical protein
MIDRHRPIVSNSVGPNIEKKSEAETDPFRDGGGEDRHGGTVDIIAMVRSLQRAAGVVDCFRKGSADCDVIDCEWRTYCLGSPSDIKK